MKTKTSMETGRQEIKGPTTPRKVKTKFKFDPPPEAPVFFPSHEEFKNPLKYIQRIRPIGQKTGICKIIPPKGWRVPFVLDKNGLKFTPRIQRINELEARTRIKLNFIDQLTKFYALRGKTFQIPIVEKRTLDFYSLHKLVRERDGFENVNKNKLWPEIAQKLDLTNVKTPNILRNHYDHIVLPFIIARIEAEKLECENDSSKLGLNSDKMSPCLRELKSLTFLGPGPKMAVCDLGFTKSIKTRTRGKKILYEFDPLAKYMCKSCSNGDMDELLVTCATCEDKYHSSCLIPPLLDITTTTWKCPKCIATDVCKPLEDFGFAQAEREYTLNEFKEMADDFKKNYFKVEPKDVPLSLVENEFWRVVSSIEESVTVEYGADLHVIDHGSGFPIKNKPSVPGIGKNDFEKYAESEWNLNNLPILRASVLRHISADISGMKIPWMYAGMCFATFCWHNEDHWSYSINYLHLGEPKTWYGVPGSCAEDFEKAMKSEAPELFDSQPDILHQLVTIMNPNDIMKTGVPIYRTDQNEGEFVITFPRAYHAGFNQGFNFAEACNFAPYDWLHIGRECISHYSSVKRFCVFSHDELVCKMAELYDELDKKILLATYKDMRTMVNSEHMKRRLLLDKGIKNACRIKFDELPDDERQCSVCKTTCFLSALACRCSPQKLVCLDHHEHLCKCPYNNKKLKYHYKIDELVAILYVVKNKVEFYDDWIISIDKSISNHDRKFYFRIFTELLMNSKDKKISKKELLSVLETEVKKCFKMSTLARKFLKSVIDTKRKEGKELTVVDLMEFCKEMKKLPCSLVETTSLNNIVSLIGFLQNAIKKLSEIPFTPVCQKHRIVQCLRLGRKVNISLPELQTLELKLKQVSWLEKARRLLNRGNEVRYSIDYLEKLVEEGKYLEEEKIIANERAEVEKLFFTVEKWKLDVNRNIESLSPSKKFTVTELEEKLMKGKSFSIAMPELNVLNSVVKKAKIIDNCIQYILSSTGIFDLNEVDAIIAEGNKLPVCFPNMPLVISNLKGTRAWLLSANKLICKKGVPIGLIEALWPRRFLFRSIFFQKVQVCDELLISTETEALVQLRKKDFACSYRTQLKSLYEVRTDNLKGRQTSQFCPCGAGLNGKFIECELCFTLYHPFCLKIDKMQTYDLYGLSKKYICSFCVRTKRPPLQKLKTLLFESRKFTIKVPEMLALEYYMSKISSWLVKARTLLSTEEMVRGLRCITENSNKINSDIRTLKNSGEKNVSSWRGIFSVISENRNIKSVELSTYGHLELRTLMLKGDILEVTLAESREIWLLVQALKLELYLANRNIPNYPVENLKSPNSKNKLNLVKKTYSNKNRKKPNIKQITTRKINILTGGGSGKVVLRKVSDTVSSLMQNGEGRGRSEEHDMEETCASDSCLRPTDDSLDWVQCDGRCGQWFHMRCVDLNKLELSEEDDFVCLQCMVKLGKNDEEEVDIVDVSSLIMPRTLLPPSADPLL